MSLNKKGFMLIETLIVTTFVVAVLIFMFVQIQNISNNYDKSFSYNSVKSLYRASNLREYLYTRNRQTMEDEIDSTTKGYIDLSSCNYDFYTLPGENEKANEEYCTSLYETLGIKKVLLSLEDLSVVKSKVYENMEIDDISQKFADFVNYVKYYNDNNKLRLLIEFNDETYASITMERM